MIYVFTFIGEFGYELLNWQGTIRKWSKNKKPGDKIVVCSRKGLDVMYESADYYYDISNLDSLKKCGSRLLYIICFYTRNWPSSTTKRVASYKNR